MRAVVYSGPEVFDVTEVPDRPLAPGEARVRCDVVGMCGTDLHLHRGEFGPRYPLIPGHEIVGTVIELGPGAQASGADTVVRVGDRVAVDNSVQCGRCRYCQEGRGWLCANYAALGVTGPGGFAEHVITPAAKCFPIGDLPGDAAVLVEPAACAVHGVDVLDLRPGSDVLVLGAGPTGQLLAQLIARGGSARVVVAAPTAFKLDVARAHGIDETLLIPRDGLAAARDALGALARGGFDAVVEATGSPALLAQCPPLVRDGGQLLVYGMAPQGTTVAFEPYEIFRREIAIKGSFAQAYCFPRAIAFLRGGRLRSAGLVTHRFGLDGYAQALATMRLPTSLKTVIEPGRAGGAFTPE